VGYKCINALMNRAIGKVITKARYRDTARKWHYTNRPRALKTAKDRHARRRDFEIEQCRQYNKKNRSRRNAYLRKRRQEDELFIVTERCRTRLRCALNGKKAKTDSTFNLIGCSPSFLAQHLTTQLQEQQDGMVLKECQIDHVFPFAMYNLSMNTQLACVMNYTNLQPLPVEANRDKEDRLPTKAMAAKVARWAWPEGVTEDMLPDKYDGWSTPLRK